jgi:L-asparaginase II
MSNPVIAEVTRGGIVESRHTGAYAVMDRDGRLIASAGDIWAPIFPRSAIKAFQCLAIMESGAADRFGLSEEEIALCCASHRGEPEHVRVARSILRKSGNGEELYECGAHWPTNLKAQHDLVRHGDVPQPVHNNCSGKHAGMLALARHLGADPHHYIDRQHPVQRAIAAAIAKLCDCDIDQAPWGVDGCSVPTWAIPLRNWALGFARFTSPDNSFAQRIIASVRAHPFMVSGTGGFDTELMQDVPEVFVKGGAEGVHCGCVPDLGIGIAVKCDDGAGRGGEVAIAAILSRLEGLAADQRRKLAKYARSELDNWRKFHVGDLYAVM